MFAIWTFRLLAFPLLMAVSPGATIHIQVLDGRNGKPIAKEHVQVWVNGRAGDAHDVPTGADGIGTLDAPDSGVIVIASDLYVDCRPFRKGVPSPTYGIHEIVSSGISAENACGKAARRAQPGQLLFFVRPSHWWEGFRR